MFRSMSMMLSLVAAGLALASSVDASAAPLRSAFVQTRPPNAITSPLQGNTKTVMITGDISQALTQQVVYTVPAHFTLELTDIVITNYNAVNCDTVFDNGPYYVTSEIRTPANAMTALSLRTGLFFASHTSVYMLTDERLPGDGACTPTFTLIGTLTKNSG
jgi:hypothetical protein